MEKTNLASRSTVSPVGCVHYKCQLNLSSKHSTLLKVEVTHRRAFYSFPTKCANKKNWLDSFLLLTSCQCGFLLTTATCTSQITAWGQMWRGGTEQKLEVKVLDDFWILVPRWWLWCLWWWPWCFHPCFDVQPCEAVLLLFSLLLSSSSWWHTALATGVD